MKTICSRCGWYDGHPIWCQDRTREQGLEPHRTPAGRHTLPAPRQEPAMTTEDRRKPDDATDEASPPPILGHAGLGTCVSYHPDDPKLIDQRPYLEFAAKRRGPHG